MVNNQAIIERVQVNIALNNMAQELRRGEAPKRPLRLAFGMRLAAALACLVLVLAGSVVAAEYFSSLSGDELALRAEYQGNGIVTIYVENQSDKNLTFEKKLKLMQWSTGEEITPISQSLQMDNTEFSAEASGVMTIDISQMYDISALEEPLADGDYYYFVLTNQSFLFGNDWHCSVDFCESEETEITYTETVELPDSGENIYAELQAFFEEWTINPTENRAKTAEYYQKVSELLDIEEQNGKHIVSTIDPWLFVGAPEDGTVFDSRVPDDMQYQLVGETHSSLDAFGIPVGASAEETCMVLSATIPMSTADTATADGSPIPLIYIFQYERTEMEKDNACAFIRGTLYSADELEQYKVYEDESYVCYNVTALFYTDLEGYVQTCTGHRDELLLDEETITRLRNIYTYYMQPEKLEKAFYYENGQ